MRTGSKASRLVVLALTGCASGAGRSSVLPGSSASDPGGAPHTSTVSKGPLFVDVGAPDDVRVDGVTTALRELRDKVAAARRDRVIAIRANADVPWGRAVGIMDLLVRISGPTWRLVVATDSSRSADVPLPTPGAKEWRVLAIAVDRAGGIAIEGKSTRHADLAAELRLKSARSDRVVIQADAEAPFGAIVDVAKIAKIAGGVVAFGVFAPRAAKARVRASGWGTCPFPPQADEAGVDEAAVLIDVHVDPEGRPLDVRVLTDPGHGFGDAARECALRASYDSARDVGGRAIEAQTGAFRVRFQRDQPNEAIAPKSIVDPSAGPGPAQRAK